MDVRSDEAETVADDTESVDDSVVDETVGVVGCIDSISETGIFGWAWYPDAPSQPVDLDIVCEGRIVGTVTADRYRNDLEAAGVGDGSCAFEFRFGGAICFADGTYGVRVSGTAVPLLSISDNLRVSQISEVVGRLVSVEKFAAQSAPAQRKSLAILRSIIKRLDDLEKKSQDLQDGQAALDVYYMRIDKKILEMESVQKQRVLKKESSYLVFVLVFFLGIFVSLGVTAVYNWSAASGPSSPVDHRSLSQ